MQEEPTHREICVSVEHFDRSGLCGVHNVPVIDRRLCDQTQAALTYPLPKHNIFMHSMRLEFLLSPKIEYLKSSLGFESNDLASPVHESTVSLNCSSRDLIVIVEIDDGKLGPFGLAYLFSNTDVFVAFKSLLKRLCKLA